MDCISGFAASIARDLVCGAVDELRYPCCFNNFVGDLQNEEDNLITTRNTVQERVDHDKNQTRKIDGSVHKWLKGANDDIDNVDKLLKEARANKSCCFGHCPDWIWRYRMSKQLVERKRIIEKRIEEGQGGNLPQIGRLATLPGLGYFSSERCLEFESRQPAYEELMEALKGDEVSMIGMYGMGGCGKTTLAIEVGKRAKQEHLFHKVLFVAVSNTVEVLEIQGKIASSLEFELQEKEEMQRAQRLCMRLTQDQEEKILVILDDVWQRLDFEAIGIPSSKNCKGFKVLITTRLERVCTSMDCQRKIYLSELNDDEASALFQKQAHISDALKHLAEQISNECKGLPVAITAVACTLKGKAEAEWKVALDRLRDSKPVDIDEGLQSPYNCLRLSYDYLANEEAKSLFLLCSVFPEDYEIPVEDLTRFAIGLGIVGEVRSYEKARNEVTAAKDKLISCCLLKCVDGHYNQRRCVKIHDLVRDVAHWIAEDENKVIRCALDKDRTVDHKSPRYLWCEQFPNDLDCSNREFLCIQTYSEVSVEIFKGMGKLRVLFLYNKDRRRRRPLSGISFKSLTILRCLYLENWELGDISFVGDMKKLESLALRSCSFLELPNDVVTQLTDLRLLDLSESALERNNFEVIGIHPQLQELYITDIRSEWDVYNENTAEFFNKFSVPQELQRYQVNLGRRFEVYQGMFPNHHRALFLSCFHTSNAAIKNLAQKAEVLAIARIQGGAKNIIPDIVQVEGGGMNDLIELWICYSEEIECLADTRNHLREVGTLFSKLLVLTIEHMKHLGALYLGRLPPSGLFQKLEKLYLDNCPQLHGMLFVGKLNLCCLKNLTLCRCPRLTSLFTAVVARSLVQLEVLIIEDCEGLKHILADDDILEEISTDDHKLLFPKLEWLWVKRCRELEYIIPITIAQGLLQLKCLKVKSNHQLKYAFGQCIHGDQSQNELKIELPALEELTLACLPNIIGVCPENCYAAWPSLRRFELRDCPEFATILESRIQSMDYQNLQEMKVCGFGELKSILPACTAGGLPQLKRLWIEDCNQLDKIIEDEEGQHFPNLHLESNQMEELPEGTSIPLAPVRNHNSGSFIACLVNVFSKCKSKSKPAFCKRKYLQSLANTHRTSSKRHLGLEQIFEDCPKSTSNSSVTLQVAGPFNLCNLKNLTLRYCSMLESLFSQSTAISLTSLYGLVIEQCHGLRYLVTYERADKNKGDIIQEDHDSQSYVKMFPKLTYIRVKNCNLLEYIFHISFAHGLAELESIGIEHTPQLRYVFGQSIHEDVHSPHQYQNKIQIELPVLKEVTLKNIPNMISICPDNYYATCSSLRQLVMENVGLSTLSASSLMVDSGARHSDHSSTMDIEAASMMNKLGSVSISNCSEIKGIFHLVRSLINGRQVTSGLEDLKFVSLQNLRELQLCGYPKLKAIFSTSVLRSLPLLKILVVRECEELEEIIEEDEENENVSSPQSPKICFPRLQVLIVRHCNNLKHLFHISRSHDFPNLEYLIVTQDSCLEEVFEVEQGVREGGVEVLFPKLKHVILMQLPNLDNICQGIEFQTLTGLLVHNCPKLSLTSTTTVKDVLRNYSHDDDSSSRVYWELRDISDIITKGIALPETTSQLQICPEDQASSEGITLEEKLSPIPSL